MKMRPFHLKPYHASFFVAQRISVSQAMPGKRFKAKEIIKKLRQADVKLGRGSTLAAACALLDITDATYFGCRKQYGGMKVG
jgi:hypothetical protein